MLEAALGDVPYVLEALPETTELVNVLNATLVVRLYEVEGEAEVAELGDVLVSDAALGDVPYEPEADPETVEEEPSKEV